MALLRHLLVLLPLLPAGGAAAQTLATQPTGRIVERLVSQSDTSQAYALYLPQAYRPDTVWPVLFLMDPRGRAPRALGLFQPAAERLGYVVISSYNTSSDGPAEPTYLAFNTMLRDVQQGLLVDPARLYLAGFSGTARLSWDIASHLRGHVAGIIGVGAGLPFPPAWLDTAFTENRFGVFLTSGIRDFNYQEVRRLDRQLSRLGFRHSLVTFDGDHSWPPEEVASRALEWLTMDAMWRRRAPMDRRWVDSLAAARLTAAGRDEVAGRRPEAYESFLAIVAQFDGLTDVDSARGRADELGRESSVRRYLDEMEEAEKREREFERHIAAFIRAAGGPKSRRELQRARSKFKVEDLKKKAAARGDEPAGLAATRMLETLFVQTGFYLRQELFQARRFEAAATALEVAHEVKPDNGNVCLHLARAYAQTGLEREALDKLACAAVGKSIAGEELGSDPLLAPLADHPEFQRYLTGPSGVQ